MACTPGGRIETRGRRTQGKGSSSRAYGPKEITIASKALSTNWESESRLRHAARFCLADSHFHSSGIIASCRQIRSAFSRHEQWNRLPPANDSEIAAKHRILVLPFQVLLGETQHSQIQNAWVSTRRHRRRVDNWAFQRHRAAVSQRGEELDCPLSSAHLTLFLNLRKTLETATNGRSTEQPEIGACAIALRERYFAPSRRDVIYVTFCLHGTQKE